MLRRSVTGGGGADIALPGLVALAVALTVLLAGVMSGVAGAAVPGWTSYDHDGARSATDPDSAAAATPAAAWGPVALDGNVYAQPLVSGSLVYVATENDSVYALNAATGAVVWQRSLGTPVPSGDLPCGDITPTVGITSTPAIDTSTGRIYLVADVLSGGAVNHELFALDAATGAVVAGFPVAVDPPGSDHTALLQRASLALDGGRVIIPYGGNAGDCSTYHGWLVSAAENGSGTPTTFEVNAAAGEHGGAVWGSGDAPAVDGAGHVFVETGNGFSSSTTPDLQESVVELDATLDVLDHWTAANWQTLDTNDTDLGSMEPLQLPGGMLFVNGKDGVGRLISATALGSTGQVFSAPACPGGGDFGAPLYHAGVIYMPCSGGLAAVSLAANSQSFETRTRFQRPHGRLRATHLRRRPRVVHRLARHQRPLRPGPGDRSHPLPAEHGRLRPLRHPERRRRAAVRGGRLQGERADDLLLPARHHHGAALLGQPRESGQGDHADRHRLARARCRDGVLHLRRSGAAGLQRGGGVTGDRGRRLPRDPGRDASGDGRLFG